MDDETEARKVTSVRPSGPRDIQELQKSLAASEPGDLARPLPAISIPAPGTLTAAGLAVGVQGVASAAAAIVTLLRVDTLVLTARLLQRTVVDPWERKGRSRVKFWAVPGL